MAVETVQAKISTHAQTSTPPQSSTQSQSQAATTTTQSQVQTNTSSSSKNQFFETPLSIMVDAGHGGNDNGATYGSIKESTLVLEISKIIYDQIKKDPSFQVSMTRWTDQYLALQDRVQKAKNQKVDLFISLHANSVSDPKVKGFEFFLQNTVPMEEDLMQLAQQENQLVEEHAEELKNTDPSKKNDIALILEDLKRQHKIRSSLKLNELLAEELQSPFKGIKQAPFYVVSKNQMPSILIELGFLSNPKEAQKLSNRQYQLELSQKIYNALVRYKEKVDKSPTSTLN